MISSARMSALYPRGKKLALCLYAPSRGFFSFLPSPFLLLARGLLTYLPFPLGLAAQRIIPFSELALNAKLAFSILHKVHGTMATCLGEETQLPQLLLAPQGHGPRGWAEVCVWSGPASHH